jgi:membrane protease YdiL (CAAX protease family)
VNPDRPEGGDVATPSDGAVPDPWPDRTSGWGLGDVAIGIGLSQLLLLIAQVVVFSLAGWDELSDVPLWATALLQIPLWAGWLVALVGAGAKGHGVVREFRVRFAPIDLPIGLGVGLVVQFVVLPVIYWPVLRMLDRTTDDLAEPARALADKAQGPWGWIVLGLVVVAGAPLVEELFYRGLLLGALRKRGLGAVLASVLCGAVFAAMHLQPLQFLGLFVLGTVLSGLVLRTGRVGSAVVAHATFNAVTVALLAAG